VTGGVVSLETTVLPRSWLYGGGHRNTSAGSLLLTFSQSNRCRLHGDYFCQNSSILI